MCLYQIRFSEKKTADSTNFILSTQYVEFYCIDYTLCSFFNMVLYVYLVKCMLRECTVQTAQAYSLKLNRIKCHIMQKN